MKPNATHWPIDQVVFMVKHYQSKSNAWISERLSNFGKPRSVESIVAKARILGLQKSDQTISPLRQRVIDSLLSDKEVTIIQLMRLHDAYASSIYKILTQLVSQGNCHIVRWVKRRSSWCAVYKLGAGKSKIKPSQRPVVEEAPRPTLPMSAPRIGLWGY